MKKSKTNINIKVKKHIALLSALMIGAAAIGFISQLAEREAQAYFPAEVKVTKKVPTKAIAKRPEVVELISNKPEVEVKIREAVKKACQKSKFGDHCISDVLGIALWETRGSLSCDQVGDGGKSYGCWQIHTGFHPDITPEQARDPEFASQWTLNRLQAYGYPKYRSYAIRRHNGSATNPATMAYLQGVNSYVK